MTWEAAADAIDDAAFAVLPCGATEQHSTHLPLSVDTIRAEEITLDLASAAAESGLELVVLPTLPYGYSEHHVHFAGTISLSPGLYEDLIVDVGRSLQCHGVDRFLVCNFHGGNDAPIRQAQHRLLREHGLATHVVDWLDAVDELVERAFDDGVEIHSSEVETSTMELYRPDLVLDDEVAPHRTADRHRTRPYAYVEELSERGGFGDPTRSDPAAMRRVLDEAIEAVVDDLYHDAERDVRDGVGNDRPEPDDGPDAPTDGDGNQ